MKSETIQIVGLTKEQLDNPEIRQEATKHISVDLGILYSLNGCKLSVSQTLRSVAGLIICDIAYSCEDKDYYYGKCPYCGKKWYGQDNQCCD